LFCTTLTEVGWFQAAGSTRQLWIYLLSGVAELDAKGEAMMLRTRVVVIISLLLSSCSLDPYQWRGTDQILGIGPTNASVLKSLRCEIITFLVENRLRFALWQSYHTRLQATIHADPNQYYKYVDYLKQYPYIDIDATQYASLQGDFKNIDTFTASLGIDWKYFGTPVWNTADYHIGPSYTDTKTSESLEPYAIPQDADLGPNKTFDLPGDPPVPKAVQFTSLYNRQPVEDQDFFCYSSFAASKATTLEDAMYDVQNLLLRSPGYEQYENDFPRIYVDGGTLAKYLQDKATSMSQNYLTFHETFESAIPGQFEQLFTLDVKPSFGASDTIVRKVQDPINPSFSAATEHSGLFSIYLNTKYSLPALQAKAGNTCIGKVDKNTGVCTVVQPRPDILQEGVKRPKKSAS
jgi:hypothetical protein